MQFSPLADIIADMATLIQPKILKGFRDFLPDAEIKRALLIEKLTAAFRSYGFVPIDTPALEYSEILLRKSDGETEKQVFRFTDNGGRDVALRFDLTVPFARFIAEHKDELYFPFKRYHIAKVWRGEKPQAGRYREFVQCDFDIVGSDSACADFEILSLMQYALSCIGVENIKIRISHRGMFNAFLAKRQLSAQSEAILRTVDKLSKIGKDETFSQLAGITGSTENAEAVFAYISGSSDFESTLSLMESLAGKEAENDAKRMREIYTYIKEAGMEKRIVLDPSITRGLDYYTGLVYETFLDSLPSIGSVCSGGRYDNLAGLYMKDKISGVGASIGLDRLIAALDETGDAQKQKGFLDAEIFCTDESLIAYYQKIARTLRSSNVSAEVFPEAKKMNQQYAAAEKKCVPFGVFADTEQAQKNLLTLKNLATREMHENLTVHEAAAKIKAHCGT